VAEDHGSKRRRAGRLKKGSSPRVQGTEWRSINIYRFKSKSFENMSQRKTFAFIRIKDALKKHMGILLREKIN
jgi:hypothetical protein